MSMLIATAPAVWGSARGGHADDALYQRVWSTTHFPLCCSANQYRVVLAQHRKYSGPYGARYYRLTSSDGGVVPLSSIAKVTAFCAAFHQPSGSVPGNDHLLNLPDNYSRGCGAGGSGHRKDADLPVDITTQFEGSALAFQSALGGTVWLLAAVVAMSVVLGILSRALFTRSPFSRRYPRQVLAPCWR
ncbi:hypothetical protein ACLK19_13925 [Escherichia coli]